MRRGEAKQEHEGAQRVKALLLGSLLALGAAVIVLLICAIAVSAGIIRMDAAPQITVGSCLVGSFMGGVFTCARWGTRRLLGGMLTGVVCFAVIALTVLVSGEGCFWGQALAEAACCMIGGGLAGVVSNGKKKSRKKVRK